MSYLVRTKSEPSHERSIFIDVVSTLFENIGLMSTALIKPFDEDILLHTMPILLILYTNLNELWGTKELLKKGIILGIFLLL